MTSEGHVVPTSIFEVGERLLGPEFDKKLFNEVLRAANLEDTGSPDAPKPFSEGTCLLDRFRGCGLALTPSVLWWIPYTNLRDGVLAKLYSSPALRCGCGGQVLELLYCYDCGESFLAGLLLRRDSMMPLEKYFF